MKRVLKGEQESKRERKFKKQKFHEEVQQMKEKKRNPCTLSVSFDHHRLQTSQSAKQVKEKNKEKENPTLTTTFFFFFFFLIAFFFFFSRLFTMILHPTFHSNTQLSLLELLYFAQTQWCLKLASNPQVGTTALHHSPELLADSHTHFETHPEKN